MAVFALVHGVPRAVREAALDAASTRLARRAGAGARSWHADDWSAWIGALRSRESRPTHDPFAVDDGHALIFDGWLRNAAELAAGLGMAAESPPAVLLLALLRREGLDALARLRGFHALAWIEPGGVHLARDVSGQRPLFFRSEGTAVYAASAELALLEAAGSSFEPEPAAIAAYLSLQAPPTGVCFLRGVQEVMAGSVVSLGSDGAQRQREAGPRLGCRSLRLRADADYAAAWREVLDVAVNDAVADADRAALSLSGGLDSAALAASWPGSERTPRLAVSWRLPGVPEADESAWIDATAAACDFSVLAVDGSACPPLASGSGWPMHPDTPLANPYRLLKQAQWRCARANGIDVLLSGNFGDHIHPGERDWLRAALRGGRFGVAMRELRLRAAHGSLLRDPGVRSLARRLLGRGPAALGPPAWLAPAARAAWRPPAAVPAWVADSVDPARFEALLGPLAAQHAAQDTGFADAEGLQVVHPYRDERVVDLALSIPTDVFSRGGVPKWLAREALRGRLPEMVRQRPKSGSLSPLFRHGLRELGRERVVRLLLEPGASWPRWLDAGRVRAALTADPPNDGDDLLLWLAISLELWLRGLERGAPVLAFLP
jgi:asparagine synthase (glutamine-hydrolysing)